MTNVFIPNPAQACRELYQTAPISHFAKTTDLILAHGKLLQRAHQNKEPSCAIQLNNWHPDLIGKSVAEVLSADLKIEDALLALSRELGYENWEAAQAHESMIDADFEKVVDHALHGELQQLDAALTEKPAFANQASSFGHKATLLLYMGSNGVEMWRQVVPENVCDVVQLLVKHGAQADAKMNVYGGQFDVLALAETSAHPRNAGAAEKLIPLLKSLSG